MLKRLPAVLTAGAIIIGSFPAQASEECLTAKGKIINNAQADGSTLGTVHLRLGNQIKWKCGIRGVRPAVSPPDFRHTVVCDNKAEPDEAQAQVTFNTVFSAPLANVTPCPPGSASPVSFSFEEISTPDPTTARGAFLGVTDEGFIHITGNLNCDGGITMEFKGDACFE